MTDLRLVPGIGAKKEKELIEMGYDSLEKLKDANPDDLYLQACMKANWQLDKCVLYAFRCAVAFAKDPKPDPDKYRWWYFCDKKEEKSK